MEENAKILEKIKKLMKLGQSDNANEASLALERAKELMDKYKISASDVVLSDVKEVNASILKADTLTEYQTLLLTSIARLFECEVLLGHTLVELSFSFNYRARPIFIGVNPNAEIAAYCFDVLNKQLEKARTEFMKGIHKRTSRSRKTFRANEFAYGWVFGINQKVNKLVPVREVPELVKQAMKKKKETGNVGGSAKTRENKGQKAEYGDMTKGYLEGSKVELRHGMGGSQPARLAE